MRIKGIKGDSCRNIFMSSSYRIPVLYGDHFEGNSADTEKLKHAEVKVSGRVHNEKMRRARRSMKSKVEG